MSNTKISTSQSGKKIHFLDLLRHFIYYSAATCPANSSFNEQEQGRAPGPFTHNCYMELKTLSLTETFSLKCHALKYK